MSRRPSRAPGIRCLVVVVGLVALGIVLFGKFYYDRINRSEDPRTIFARQGFLRFERALADKKYADALAVLSRISAVYAAVPGYKDSYERGVVHNNRGTVFLLQAEETIVETGEPRHQFVVPLLKTAQEDLQAAVACYERWMEDWGRLDRPAVRLRLRAFFAEGDPAFGPISPRRILAKRVSDVLAAQVETPRRLSVSLTNLGIVYRYLGDPDKARAYYEKALALWPKNPAARENLNVLLGRPVPERSVLRRIFPEKRVP